MHLVIGTLGLVTELIDSIGKSVGSDWGLTKGVRAFQASLDQGVINGTGVMKSWVGQGQSMPVVADRAHQTAVYRETMSNLSMSQAAGDQHITMHVPLIVDGDKLAEAHATAKRSAAARGYRDVPATAGGY